MNTTFQLSCTDRCIEPAMLPSGQALYLASGAALDVSLDSGIALKVQAPGQARSLYPLRRISRIHSATDVHWSIDALLGCLEAGIPVVFHDAAGNIRGWCFGPRQKETTLAALLREACAHPDWPQFWAAWIHRIDRREARAVARDLRITWQPGQTAAQLHINLCNLMRDRWQCPPGPWVRALRAALRTLAAEVCTHLVGAPEALAYPAPGINLPETLANLALARADAILLRQPAALVTNIRPDRLAAQIMETQHAEIYRACAGVLGNLERSLREWTF